MGRGQFVPRLFIPVIGVIKIALRAVLRRFSEISSQLGIP